MNFDFDRESRFPEMKTVVRKVLIWVLQIGAMILLAFLLTHFGVQKITVQGDAMSPTLNAGESIIVNKMLYHVSSPSRNDVIVFQLSGSEHNFYYVRRIVGLPGETVQIKDGSIYINDKKLEESINVEAIANSGLATSKIVLEDGEYFVLGDNRNNSIDSRFSSIGLVIKDQIIGKAWIRSNGFKMIGGLNLKEKTEESASPDGTGTQTSAPSPTAK